MANIRDPQFGVKKDKDTLITQDPASVLYGVTPDDRFIPIKVSDTGELIVGTGLTLDASDLQIGAVELKNYNTDDRAYVSPDHEILAQGRIYDAAGNALTSTGGALNANITNSTLAVTQSGIWNINNISGTVSLPTGASTEATLAAVKTQTDKLTFSSTRLLIDGSGVTQPISGTITANIGTTNGLALDATLAKLTITQGTALGSNTIALMGGSVTTSAPTYTTGQISPLSLDTTGALRVNITAGLSSSEQHTVDSVGDTYTVGTTKGIVADARVISSAPSLISGQFSALTLSTAGRLFVDGSGVTQPISGTVIANIGTTNGLALDTTVAALEVSQGSTTSGQNGILMQAAATTAAPTYINGQTSPLTLTLAGRLRSDIGGFGGTAVTLGQKVMTSSMPVVIASDQAIIPVTDAADGSVTPGTVATKSMLVGGQYNSTAPTLTNTQQASLQVDASGNLLVNVTASTTGSTPPTAATISAYTTANKVYVTAFNVNMPTSGTDNPLLLVRNPTGSGKTLYVYKLGFGSTVANVSAVFKVFSDPTVTANGTSQAATSLNIGGGAPAASILSTSTPTITANGAEIESYEAGSNNNSGSFVEDFSIHVAANHALLITGNPGSNNRDAALTIVWVEV